MHEAFVTSTVLKNLPLHIECMTCYDNTLLIGTRKGHLLRYIVRSDNSIDFETSKKDFANKPVIQLVSVKHLDTLLSLSDGNLSMYRLQTLSYVSTIGKARGANLFDVDILANGEVRLCVAVKRRLLLLVWRNGDWTELRRELALPEMPRLLRWFKDCVLIYLGRYYFMVRIDTGDLNELFQLGNKCSEPVATVVRYDRREILAVLRDEGMVFVDNRSRAALKFTMTWTDHPINVIWSAPYLVGILSQYVEVRSLEPRLYVQSVEHPNVRVTCSCNGSIYLASYNTVWKLTTIPRPAQVNTLLANKEFELALRLAKDIDPEEKGAAEVDFVKIKHLHAFNLFVQRRFEDALKTFEEVNTNPTHVIGLFPSLLPEEFRERINYPDKVPNLAEEELHEALDVLVKYLTTERRRLQRTVEVADDAVSNIVQASFDSNSSSITLSQRLNEDGLDNLVQSYRPIGGDSSLAITKRQTLREIVDTTLLKCYLQVKDVLVASLLRLPDNNCHLEESERMLLKAKKIEELIILYERRGLHHKALQLLMKQSSRPAAETYASPDATVEYLQRLGPQHLELIFEFSEWVLRREGEKALRLFTEDLPEVDALPKEKVLQFLEKKVSNLVLPYLEHIVSAKLNNAAELTIFQNKLANAYRIRVQDLMQEYLRGLPEGHYPVAAGQEPGELGLLRQRLLTFLRDDSITYSPERLLSFYPLDGFYEERALLLGRMGRFDLALAIYVHVLDDWHHAEKYCDAVYAAAIAPESRSPPSARHVYFELLRTFLAPPDPKALGIIPPPAKAGNNSIDGFKIYCKQGAAMLQKYGSRIDPERALQLLPVDTLMKDIQTYLHKSMGRLAVAKRSALTRRALLANEHRKARVDQLLCQSIKFTVLEDDFCSFCKKRIATAAFGRAPDGSLLHYGCVEEDKQYKLTKPLSREHSHLNLFQSVQHRLEAVVD